MALWKPDPTFYPSPRDAASAPPESLAYVAAFDRAAEDLPPVIAPFGALPPLVTDIDLSVDDRYLYVSCWGTGELKRYDVTDPYCYP